jgi:hypothetical protein
MTKALKLISDNCSRINKIILEGNIPPESFISSVNGLLGMSYIKSLPIVAMFAEKDYYSCKYYFWISSRCCSIGDILEKSGEFNKYMNILEFEKTDSYAKHFAIRRIIGE